MLEISPRLLNSGPSAYIVAQTASGRTARASEGQPMAEAKRFDMAALEAALAEMCTAAHEDVFYVGDSEGDARATIAAGLSFAWASYGYGRTKPDGTARVLHSFGDVLGL